MSGQRIWLSLARMCGEEMKFIQNAFETNWIVPNGPNVNRFEKDLESFFDNTKRIVALSSGTAAIHLGLIQLNVKPGDEVICQTFTFTATVNPVKYLGATPIFVDSEKDTWNMCPILLEEAIKDRINKTGKKPKAIIPVHLYGMPAKMDKIMAVARKYEIPVLEDAAEALGSTYKGQKCGTFGEFACLSFNGNKIITTSGGGALICSNDQQAAKTMFLSTQARDQAPHYQHSQIGYNYRMSNVCAGIGCGQMTALNDFITRRREINKNYREKLAEFPGITVLDNPSKDFESNHWLTCVLVDPLKAGFTAEELRVAMDQADIETRPLWKPMHMQPVFWQEPYYENGTSRNLFAVGLCLPSSPAMDYEDENRILNVFHKMYKKHYIKQAV